MLNVSDGMVYRSIREVVLCEVSSKNVGERINNLLRDLFAGGVHGFAIERQNTWGCLMVTVELKNERNIVRNGAELYIPRVVQFSVDRKGITFSEDEPYAILAELGEPYGHALNIRD